MDYNACLAAALVRERHRELAAEARRRELLRRVSHRRSLRAVVGLALIRLGTRLLEASELQVGS